MSQAAEKTVEELEARYKQLSQKGSTANQMKMQIEAAFTANKRSLKETMEECKAAGWNPDNIQEELRRAREVLSIKLDNYEADLDAATSLMKPMLKEITG